LRNARRTVAWNPLRFPLIVALPKGHTFNAEYYHDNILAALTQFQPEDDGRKFVIHTDNARTHTAQKCRTFAKKMDLDCGSFHIHPIHLISHHPTSFCSVMSKNVSKEWCFHHTRNYSTLDAIGEVMTGIELETLTAVFEHWRDWNRCLRTMVITIHKLPVGSFTFLQCLSGTELLNLSGIPYRLFSSFIDSRFKPFRSSKATQIPPIPLYSKGVLTAKVLAPPY
jgi:hypothetical protein